MLYIKVMLIYTYIYTHTHTYLYSFTLWFVLKGKWRWKSLSHVWLCYPRDCSPPGFSVRGILQARILEWVAVLFSRGSSQPKDWISGLPHCWQVLCQLSHQRSPRILGWVAYPFSRGYSKLRSWPGSPASQVDSLPVELPGRPRVYPRTLNIVSTLCCIISLIVKAFSV